jgi:hypothetical protein
MATIIFSSLFNQALAIQLTAGVSPQLNVADADFKGDRILTLKYPQNSQISSMLNGKKESVSFTLNSSDPNNGLQNVLSAINSNLLREKQSQVQLENASLNYRASMNGGATSTTITFQVELRPTIKNLVTATNGTDSSIIDLDWRGFDITEPLNVTAPQYGSIDINHPMGGIEKLIPELAPQLASASALTGVLNQPLMNFEDFGVTMNNWHFLFDATGAQAGAAGFGFNVGQNGSKIVSIYSLGESSFREGTHTVKEASASGNVGGVNVNLNSLTAPPSGQIQIGGFSKIEQVGGHEFAIVSSNAPQGVETSSGGFPIQVLLIFGAMMAGVSVLVLLKARK